MVKSTHVRISKKTLSKLKEFKERKGISTLGDAILFLLEKVGN